MMRDRFIPVILDGYLKGTASERAFLKQVGLAGNGFTYLAASGRKLGDDSYLGASGMPKALDVFQALPGAERKPGITRPVDPGDSKGVPLAPPPGCLIASVHFTYLQDDGKGKLERALWHVEGQPGTEPGSGHGRNQVLTHIDKLWLTREEWKSLVPPGLSPGQKLPLPPAIHQRLVRFYASDLAHRSAGEKVRAADLALAVEQASADGVTLKLEGTVKTGCAFEAAPRPDGSFETGADFQFLGYLEYDARKDVFTRFDIVALGEGWGGGPSQAATTNFYRGGEHRRWPMGIAFQLVTTRRPIDLLPPQNANPYRCDSYFKVAKSSD